MTVSSTQPRLLIFVIAYYAESTLRRVLERTGFCRVRVRAGSEIVLLGARLPGSGPRDLHIPIDLHGGENLPDSGGALVVTTWCDLTIPSGIVLNALGDRGSIHVSAGGLLTAYGQLRAGGELAFREGDGHVGRRQRSSGLYD